MYCLRVKVLSRSATGLLALDPSRMSCPIDYTSRMREWLYVIAYDTNILRYKFYSAHTIFCSQTVKRKTLTCPCLYSTLLYKLAGYNSTEKRWNAKSVAWSSGDVFVMPNATQVLLTNANVIHKCTWSLSIRCAINADNIVYIMWVCINRYFYGIKFEKLGNRNPDIAFPERLHEKTPSQFPRKCRVG
jgi:hypothetical protein